MSTLPYRGKTVGYTILTVLGALALWALLLLQPRDCVAAPEQMASLEKGGWQAYYERDWARVLVLMVRLNRTQFCMSWFSAIVGALDLVRAAAAFAPVDNDISAATAHLTHFYAKAQRTADLAGTPAQLAELEVDYWIVHRSLAQDRARSADHSGDLTPMIDALNRLHAQLFTASPAAIRRSAELRAQAAATVDRITGGYSTDVAADWNTIELLLSEAYRAVTAETVM